MKSEFLYWIKLEAKAIIILFTARFEFSSYAFLSSIDLEWTMMWENGMEANAIKYSKMEVGPTCIRLKIALLKNEIKTK